MNCPECNAFIEEEFVFCDQCGIQLKKAAKDPDSSVGTIEIEENVLEKVEIERTTEQQQELQKTECKAQEKTTKIKNRVKEQTAWQTVEDNKDAGIKKAIPKERRNRVHSKETRLSLKKHSLFSSKKLWIGVSLVTLLAAGGIVYLLHIDVYAVRLYRMAAYIGYTPAMHRLGWMYEKGRGVDHDDAEAIRWYRKAADKGNGDAMVDIAFMYLHGGKGIAEDQAKAFRWFHMAAERGEGIAMLWVGLMFHGGEGVAKDYAKAEFWYRKAFDMGNPVGAMRLGYMYEKGHGVAKDRTEAIRWYQKAADGGYSPGKSAIESLDAKMK